MMKKWYCLLIIIFLTCIESSASSKGRPGPQNTLPINNILSDTNYTNLEVEIIYDKLTIPNSYAIACINSKLHFYCHKQSIQIFTTAISTVNTDTPAFLYANYYWTNEILNQLTNYYQIHKTHDKTLVLHILYLSGFMLNNIDVIGETFSDTSFVIFKWRIPSQWEASILVHELGHLLGLVDSESPWHDSKHQYHCINKQCAMYWRIEETPIPPLTYDDNCENYLYQHGAKHFR